MDPLLVLYIERVLAILLSIYGAEIEYSDPPHEIEGVVRFHASIRFSGGSRLYVRLAMDAPDGFPRRRFYAFHYMTADNATIFRYDNSDYHPGLPHEPHHKHEGESGRVIGCPQPSVSAIRDEIETYLKGLN